MRGCVKKQRGMILLLLPFLCGPVLAASATIKIKTRTPTAVLRLEPNPAGEMARGHFVLGTEFDVERKIGEWYEVKHESELGAVLAYIHENDVEIVAGRKPPSPVRAATEKAIAGPSGKSLVLSLGGGPVFAPTWDVTSTSHQWFNPYEALQSMADSNTLALSLKPQAGVALGLGLTYFLSPSLGLQFRIDIMPNRPIVDGLNEYTMTWKWLASPTNYALDPSPTWPVSGFFRTWPFSLSLLVRPGPGPRLQPYVQAGIALFLSRFKAESQIGYAETWVDEPYQHVDYYTLPVSIDEYFDALGFMAGAGLEWLLGSRTAVFVQADYFAGTSGEVGWSVAPGTYSAQFSSKTLSIDENSGQLYRGHMPPFTVKVGGLFRLLAGLKVSL